MNAFFTVLLLVLLSTGSMCGEDFQPAWPEPDWLQVAPAQAGLDEAKLVQARDYALTGSGSGCIIRHGKRVMAWGDPKQRYDLKSTTKSFGAAALGLAIIDGKIGLDDKARQHHPTLGIPPENNARNGWCDEITIRHLASQTAGFEKPGGYVPMLFQPGTEWGYSDSGPNWLAECIPLAYRWDVEELLFERLFTPLGIQRSDLVWRKNAYRPELIDGIQRREFGSGISANVYAMARFGYLWLRGGEWNGKEILPGGFVNQVRTTVPGVPGLPVRKPEEYGKAANHNGLLWWNNADGTIPNVPRDTYWTWGLYDSLLGTNVRSPTAEAKGDGKLGRKASGMLCVEGVLYLLVRNADNAHVTWSADHGATWSRADWKFSVSLGCPTFLNFGKDYAGARDHYVYLYSPDADSAYVAAGRMVVARVPQDQIRQQEAYEFYAHTDANHQPVWTQDLRARGAVFANPGACYRSGVTYNAGLKR